MIFLNFPKGKNEKEWFEKNKIEKYKKMNMMILKMEMILILKELKQLLLIIFALLLIFIIFYQVHFKKKFIRYAEFYIFFFNYE